MGAYMAPVGFPPGFYGQYAPPPSGRPGEAPPTYFPQFYIAQVPPPSNADGETTGYSHPQFYPAFVPYGNGYAPYMMHRPDGQIVASYAIYPKPPSADGSSDRGMSSSKEPQMAAEQEEEEEVGEVGDSGNPSI